MIKNKKKGKPIRTDRVGEINTNLHGTKMQIIKYCNCHQVTVMFLDQYLYKKETDYGSFIKGLVTNPYDKTLYEVGYLGVGKLKATINRVSTIAYKKWSSMIKRCYVFDSTHLSYQGCIVCEEWLCYQNFAKWWKENYYELGNEKMCLDKDILIKDNKTYSPENCLIVPISINSVFTCHHKNNGYPKGVSPSHHSKSKPYTAKIELNNKQFSLGVFKTRFEAFNIYKQAKENSIKQMADEYRAKYSNFPQKLYEALYQYEVRATD